MPSDRSAGGWKTYRSKQFGYWLLLAVPAFVVAVLTLQAVVPGYAIALAVGLLMNELLTPAMEWLQDWQAADNEVTNST